jgi:hypothetical protein
MVKLDIVGAPQARFTQVQMPWPKPQHKAVLRIDQAIDHLKERSYDQLFWPTICATTTTTTTQGELK